MFYTRPELPPLNLDLVKIEGGGSRPAQFNGQTADGRPVYIRYRGGRFSVECGEVGESDGSAGRVLLDTVIGPYLHGDMLVEQACDLAGLTVRGNRMILTEEKRRAAAEKAAIMDWSGRTTYWVRDLQVTKEGGRRFVEKLATDCPSLLLLELWWDTVSNRLARRYRLRDTIEQCEGPVTLAFEPNPGHLAKILSSNHVRLAEVEGAFAHTLNLNFRWNESTKHLNRPKFIDRLGRKFVTPGPDLAGRLSARFATADPNGEAFIQKVIAIADLCFSNLIETVDLATGETIGFVKHQFWHSLDLREWSRAEPDRYLGWFDEGTGDAVRHLGFRPATAGSTTASA